MRTWYLVQFLIQKLVAAFTQELCLLSSFTIVTGITIVTGSIQNLCVESLIWKERCTCISTVTVHISTLIEINLNLFAVTDTDFRSFNIIILEFMKELSEIR